LVSLQQDMTGEMVQKLLLDSVQTRQARLEASSLSPAFKALERERQRYQVMRQAFKYQHWTTEDVPFIEKQIKEQPELLPTEEYSAFLREALSFIAWFQVSERTYYPLAKAQMEYLNTHFRDTAIVDFLMESVLTNYMTYRGATDITPMLNIFNQRVTSPTLREKIKRDYEKYARILRGASVPDFTFIDTKGKEVKLSSFKGKYVYIDCWASWCGPCRAQIPHLKKLEHDYAGKDIAFVSISSDDNRDKWKKTVEKEQLGGTQLIIQCATNNEFADYFIITGIPRFLLLDKEGKVYDAYAPRPSEPAIRQLFDSLP
jgi:thiol-disulfide isomerase/thioredoxin